MAFLNRKDAGRQLAELLRHLEGERPIVLALPRGGVVVGFEVARLLNAPMDVWVVRKIGAPGFQEFGIGAVAEGGITYVNPQSLEQVDISQDELRRVIREKEAEVEERVQRFRRGVPRPDIQGRTVILVDDGIATGGTVRAAIQSLRMARPQKIVLAVPVAASQSLEELRKLADEVACVVSTPRLHAIGAWYGNFEQVQDEEVVEWVERARRLTLGEVEEQISIALNDVHLKGTLTLPAAPKGLVLFAHGSGSSRLSPRNRHVAQVLQRKGLATLLFDLLTSEEEVLDQETAELRFDIDLLAQRLMQTTDWAHVFPQTSGLTVGYFGSSTGAAAALVAASAHPEVRAVVSRGGRPDLAGRNLERVSAPTLLIVGGEDHAVIALNRRAYSALPAPKELVIVPGATHLFEEPGTLDEVARLAADWFVEHLGPLGREAPAEEAHQPL